MKSLIGAAWVWLNFISMLSIFWHGSCLENWKITKSVHNVYRVQESFVSQKRSPWLSVVLVLAALAFVGFSMVPLLGSVFQESQPSAGATPATKQAELESQAKSWELVLQKEPQNPKALQELAKVRLQQGNFKAAVAPLEQFVKLNPDQSDYAVLLAQLKQQIGDREGAAQTYRTILASKPGNLNALQGFVSLQIQQNRPEAAIGLLQDTLKTATQVNEIKPGTVDIISVQLLLGQVYASQKRFTESIVIYDEAIKANKQDFRPVLGKALILKAQGRNVEAKPLFTTAVSLAPAQYKDQVKQLASDTPPPSSSPSASPGSPSTDSKAPDASSSPSTDSKAPGASSSPSTDSKAPGASSSPSTDSKAPDASSSPSTDSKAPADSKTPSDPN